MAIAAGGMVYFFLWKIRAVDDQAILLATAGFVGQLIFLMACLHTPKWTNNIFNKRMQSYAQLKPGFRYGGEWCEDVLNPYAHEVLLGAAKKVETKAVSLLTVWVLVCSGILVALSLECMTNPRLCFAALALAVPILFSLVRIFRQVDTLVAECNGATPQDLQTELANDLLAKEAYFRFAYYMTYWAIALFGLVVMRALFFEA